jgi:hypothetical protein
LEEVSTTCGTAGGTDYIQPRFLTLRQGESALTPTSAFEGISGQGVSLVPVVGESQSPLLLWSDPCRGSEFLV